MSQLTLNGLGKSFGTTRVLDDINLHIEEGEFVVFVGPSGCGKSTLLRLIAGLEEANVGDIIIADKPVNRLPPVKRGIAMVFQSYALYPHMSVFENIAFPLRVERLPEKQIRERVAAAADVLQLDTRLEERPGNLSGGQRQRVAIGRAIVRQPRIFLFDEPLSNLDAALRSDMRIELLRLHGTLGTTMIYVTHDQVEAMTMADTIVVLNEGRIEQTGSPMTLYHQPANRFVAGFIGSPRMNFLDAQCVSVDAQGITLEVAVLGTLVLPRLASDKLEQGIDAKVLSTALSGQRLTLGIRPEHIELPDARSTDASHKFTLTPGIVERLGSQTIVHATSHDSESFLALFEGDPALTQSQSVSVFIDPSRCHLFGRDGSVIY